MIIKDFKTGKNVSNDFYTLLANVSCNCGSKELTLVKNERSDASYEYLVICSKCKNKIGKITWENQFEQFSYI